MSFDLSQIKIRQFNKSDSLVELTDLLHRSYKILADMNLKYLATYQDVETTGKRIEKGICFVATINEKIIGTITYYNRHRETEIKPDWLNSAWVGQMGVEPEFQKNGIGSLLMDHVEFFAINNKEPMLALDTSEKAAHLINWYNKRGYLFHDYVQWDITNYRSVILKKIF